MVPPEWVFEDDRVQRSAPGPAWSGGRARLWPRRDAPGGGAPVSFSRTVAHPPCTLGTVAALEEFDP